MCLKREETQGYKILSRTENLTKYRDAPKSDDVAVLGSTPITKLMIARLLLHE